MGKNLIQQKRGKGSPTYRRHSFKAPGMAKTKDKGSAKILSFFHSSFHTAPLAHVEYQDGTKGIIIASEGLQSGQQIKIGDGADLALGNALKLKDLPEGSMIFNIEGRPGDGGKFVRSSGGAARIVGKTSSGVMVQFPSKKKKLFHVDCKATLGMAAGGGRLDKPLLKAGIAFHRAKARNKYWPIVSGTAMNAVDHPLAGKRSSRKGRPTIAPKNAPPGRKVGMIRPRHTGRNK